MIQKLWRSILQREIISKPLGRWCHCGEKNTKDVLVLKDELKRKRVELKEKKIDPYLLLKQNQIEEEYMLPFILQM